MTLEECRKNIDAIDPQIRQLLMKRVDCAYCVAQAKQAAGETNVYRADREAAILERLGAEVPEDRRAGYLAVVRKVMETSRMYQYGLLYDWNEGIFDSIAGSSLIQGKTSSVKVHLTRQNRPNAMSSILAMIGDYGYNMSRMELMKETEEKVTFELTILGDATLIPMKKLLFQLSKESENFCILECVSLTDRLV